MAKINEKFLIEENIKFIIQLMVKLKKLYFKKRYSEKIYY